MRNTMNTLKKRKPSNRANVLPLTPRRGEAMDLVKFIDANVGAAWRVPLVPSQAVGITALYRPERAA